MFTIFVGLLLVAFTVFASLSPELHGLGWKDELIHFLKGFLPVLSAFLGIIAILVGSADVKDKREAKRAEREIEKSESEKNAGEQ